MTAAGYAAMVADAVAAMAQPGATLRKVVLSRPVEVRLHGTLSLSAVLRRLRAGEPNCTIFSMPVPDGSFFGASPELLVARHGTGSRATPWPGPCRGATPPGPTPTPSATWPRSAKNRAEHRYVVDDIAAALAPFCAELSVPTEPSVVAFRSVAHLGHADRGAAGRSTGRGARAPGAAPSDAGRRRDAARRGPGLHRAATRRAQRGHWAGPVGWVGAGGDGEWMIGIRSAQLDADGATLTLRAGGGSWPTPTPTPRRPRPTSSWPPCSTPCCPAPQCSCGERSGARPTAWPAGRHVRRRPAGS